MKPWFVIAIIVACSTSYAEKHSESTVAFSVYGGPADHNKNLHRDSFIAMITVELVEPPIGYELLAIGIGNASFFEDRIEVGTLGFILNLVPIHRRWMRLSVGGGGGFAAIEQVSNYEKYEQTGGHVVGQGSLMFFSPSLRVGVKAIWIRTRFAGGNIPVLDETQDVGSGLYYLAGISFEIPL